MSFLGLLWGLFSLLFSLNYKKVAFFCPHQAAASWTFVWPKLKCEFQWTLRPLFSKFISKCRLCREGLLCKSWKSCTNVWPAHLVLFVSWSSGPDGWMCRASFGGGVRGEPQTTRHPALATAGQQSLRKWLKMSKKRQQPVEMWPGYPILT